MPLILLLLFPLAEIAVFILVGGAIGVVRTLALIVVSSALGAVMLRDASIMTVLKLRQGGNPVAIAAEGGTRMLAGLLLLIPGFLTDLAAGLVLVPPVRKWLLAKLSRRASPTPTAHPDRQVIEGDFRRLDREG